VSASVTTPTAADCCLPALVTLKRAETSAHERQSAHQIGMEYFLGCACSGFRLRLNGRRSGVRPWAPPTDVTTTNPRTPNCMKDSAGLSYGRAVSCCVSSQCHSKWHNPSSGPGPSKARHFGSWFRDRGPEEHLCQPNRSRHPVTLALTGNISHLVLAGRFALLARRRAA